MDASEESGYIAWDWKEMLDIGTCCCGLSIEGILASAMARLWKERCLLGGGDDCTVLGARRWVLYQRCAGVVASLWQGACCGSGE